MKKLISILLIAMLAISLTACGGGNDAELNNADKNAVQQEQNSIKKDGFTLLEVEEELRNTDLEITSMKIEKDVYAPGEKITVNLEWTGIPDSSAWVGIIPADIPHGDEYVNDDADVAYIYLTENEGSAFTFRTLLEAGKYTLRVNENDGGGPELAWCAFTVEGEAVQEDEQQSESEEGAAAANGEVIDFTVGIDGVPVEWQKGIGEELYGMEVSADGSDFSTGYLQKFGNVSEEDYTKLIAYFDTLTYIEKLDSVYNCEWGQLQIGHNAAGSEMTVTWYVN